MAELFTAPDAPVDRKAREARNRRRSELIEYLRYDRDAFIEAILGFEQAPLHREIQKTLSDHHNCAVTTHRGAGKTDQVSVGRTAWEIGHDPEIRIKAVKNVDTEASKITDALRSILTSDLYREIFPHIRPNEADWSGKRFSVVRSRVGEKEPTFQSYGVLSTATGGRADLIIYDDICDAKNSIQQPASREAVKTAYRNTFQPMLVKGGRVWRVYTPYHVSDITADWEKNRNIHTISRPIVGWTSPFPEMFSPEMLKEIAEDIGPIAFGRAYRLQRVSDADIMIRPEWLDPYMYGTRPRVAGRWVGSLDFAYAKKKLEGVKLAGNDPDYCVALKSFVTNHGHVYCDRMIRVREPWPDFKARIIPFLEDCEITVALDVGAEVALIQELNRETPLTVKMVRPDDKTAGQDARGGDKRTRLSRESAAIEAGKLHLRAYKRRGEWVVADELSPLYDELLTFPVSDHDDCVDCVTQLLYLVRKYYRGKQRVDDRPVKTREELYRGKISSASRHGHY